MTVRQPARAYNDHNVYILGAGFSVEAGLPLMKDFMNRMRDAQEWLERQAHREQEIEAIKNVLDFRAEAAAAAYRVPLDLENIEELFSLVAASGSNELWEQVTIAIAATLEHSSAIALKPELIPVTRLLDTAWEKPPNWLFRHDLKDSYGPQAKGSVYSCPIYELYLGLLCGYFNDGTDDRRDTVISLNYDTVVEDALSGLGLTYRYADNEMVEWRPRRPWTDVDRRPIAVLKLHGSLNVAARLQRDIDVLQLIAYPSYQCLRSERQWPILVAPTWQKSFGGYLSAVWQEAVSVLRTATRVVMMGYSVPKTDQHFRYLLAAGLQENISLRRVVIVNSDDSKEFRQRLCWLFRPEQLEQNGIVTVIPRTVRQFLVSENGGYRIGRPFKDGAWRLAN